VQPNGTTPSQPRLEAKRERTPYRTPKLVHFGTIASFTEGGTIASANEDTSFFLQSIT
jgi:hypothetical protein